MRTGTDSHATPSHARGSRAGGTHRAAPATAAVAAAVPNVVPPNTTTTTSSSSGHSVHAAAAPSSSASPPQSSQFSPAGAAPRSIVPQPRSSMVESRTREATTAADRVASPRPLEDFKEASTLRNGQAGRQRRGGTPATAANARRNSTPYAGGDGEGKTSGGSQAHMSKRTNSNPSVAPCDSNALRHNNTSNESGSSGGAARRRTGAATGGGSSAAPSSSGTPSNNNNNNNSMSNGTSSSPSTTAASLMSTGHQGQTNNTTAQVNSGGNDGGSSCGPSATVSRHLQPPANHSHVNLFVRDLPLDMKEDQLRTMFAPYGKIVNSAIMRNIHTGVSLGTAFVRFAEHAEAMKAMEAFAGGRAMAGSRRVTVQWAKKEHDKAPAGEERKRMRKLFIRNVPKDVTHEMLVQLFSQFGVVKTVSTHRDTAAANAVAQPGGAATTEVMEVPMDLSVSAGSLSLPTNAMNNNNGCDDRRIAFVTFDAEGVAERATAAIHNTMPFPSCNGIPLMVKLAEDTPMRHTASNNNNNSSNNNANFAALGALGSAASIGTMSTGNVGGAGHPFSLSGQLSTQTVNWGDFTTNEYLHSPTMSPPMMHLGVSAGPSPFSGLSHTAATASTWRTGTPTTIPQGGFRASSPEGLRPLGSSGNNNNQQRQNNAAPSLSAPRPFGVSVVGNAPSPSSPAFTGITPMSSGNNATPPYVVHSHHNSSNTNAGGEGPAVLRHVQPPQPAQLTGGISALVLPRNVQVAASPSNPLALELLRASPSQQPQQSSSTHEANTATAANSSATPVGAQTSLQDLCGLGYMVSGNDMYTFQPLTSASPEIMGLVTGTSMAIPSYDTLDYFAFSNSYSSRGIIGTTPAVPPAPPQHALAASQNTYTSPGHSPRNASTAAAASPSPALPSFATGQTPFLRYSPRGPHGGGLLPPASAAAAPSSGHPTTVQPAFAPPLPPPSTATPTMQPTNAVAASLSSTPRQPPEPHGAHSSNSNNGSSGSGASPVATTVVPPAPRSDGSTGTSEKNTKTGEKALSGSAAAAEKGGVATLSAVHSDLAANRQSRAGRRAKTMQSTPATAHPYGLISALTTSNPEPASSFSSTSTRRYQPYDVTGILDAGSRGGYLPPDDTGSTHAASPASGNSNSAVAGPSSLRTAPPTLPTSLPLPPGASPTAPVRQFFAQRTTVSPADATPTQHAATTTAAAAAAVSAASASPTFILPLEATTLGPFDYDNYNDTDCGDTPSKSQRTSSYAAEVLRAVTEDTQGEGDAAQCETNTALTTDVGTVAAPSSPSGHSRGRRRTLTSPSGMLAHKESSDGEGRTSDLSSAAHTIGTRGGSSSAKPMSLTLGAPTFLEEQMLYRWDGTAASATSRSNSPSPAGAIGSQAPSPVAGLNQSKNTHNVFNLMPPSSTSITQSLTMQATDPATSVSNMWMTSDVSPYWGAAQMKDPLTTRPPLNPTPGTVMLSEVAKGNSAHTAASSSAGAQSPGDLSRRSTARTMPGMTLPLAMSHEKDSDEEQAVWGTYPDLTLNLSWDVGSNTETQRRSRDGGAAAGLDPLLYGQQITEDAERLYKFMTYDDGGY
jgi:RNA recognition motif-containing protein